MSIKLDYCIFARYPTGKYTLKKNGRYFRKQTRTISQTDISHHENSNESLTISDMDENDDGFDVHDGHYNQTGFDENNEESSNQLIMSNEEFEQ